MDVEQLFVRTLADLGNRIVATDEYEVLMSAGLLRKLLMEGITLVDKVNSRYKLRIRYPMNDVSAYERIIYEDAPVLWSLLEGIDPDCPIAQMPGMRAPIHATREQLLARRVMRTCGTWITVRDLIDQLAHIDGAVHSHEPKSERELILQAAAQFFHLGRVAARCLWPSGIPEGRSPGGSQRLRAWPTGSPAVDRPLQAGQIPRWGRSRECYALSLVAAVSRWSLPLLSPLLPAQLGSSGAG